MPLPLFDDVVVDALRGLQRPAGGASGGRTVPPQSTGALPEFELDDPRPKSHRPALIARHGTPEYVAYWSAFAKGSSGQSAPGAEHDDRINRYLRDGYRLGKLVGWKPPKETR